MTLLGIRQQRLADLHLYLYSRSLHPELFQIYAAEQYRGAAYEADVWVIGCSHLVSFRSGKSVLTELTAGQADMLGENHLLQRWRLRGERTCRQSIDNGRVNYIASFGVEQLSEHLYRQQHAELVAEGKRKGMLAQFSQWQANPDGSGPPFAYVNCEILPRELRVNTFHGFPDEHCLVKTQSIFEL
jgi:hypothetical protein